MSRSVAWVAHLRSGGTTPWRAFCAQMPDTAPAPADAADIPGAQQLEALRRLNQVGRPSPTLVDRVLAGDLVGRGRGDLGLLGEPHVRFGTPPVDPAELPTTELLRVLTGLLAEDVVRTGLPQRPAGRRPRIRRVRYQLSGDPWLAVPMRAELARHGYPPGGGRAVTYLVGRDLGGMLIDAWTRRSLVDGAAGWEAWLRKLRRADRLPARADLARQARWWARRVGPENVRIVTDPALVPSILGVDLALPRPPVLAADALDLARRISPLVGLFAGPGHREELMLHGLVPRLARVPGAPLALPQRFEGWVARRARLVHEELTGGDYAVLGDPALVLGGPGAAAAPDASGRAGGSPSEEAVLTLALRTLLENDPHSRVEGA
ncbi:hypothetical protein P5P86_02315 [Nocardioides sp. BP30]|uniref:hypothetical protein n=1 Tax=Nocardioides sp. BP30 TaxID=3036374 RepID=UPI002468D023|nr:hypothetical protein [Nocardioides sp. BP30]WGL52668.1 hypothetical protein P5P86_02315 [Nocardioides sp. BP30]